MSPATRPGASLSALALCLALAGCGAKNFDNDNDALRRQVATLEQERDAALARAVEAESKLSEAVRAKDSLLEGQTLEALPRCAGVNIDRFSGLADSNGDGASDSVDFYVVPFDGRQRFVQVAGRLTVEATILPPSPSQEPPKKGKATTPPPAPSTPPAPIVVGPRTLTPVEVREAYRSSLLGTHYLVTLPLPDGASAPAGSSVVLRVELLDPTTGIVHKAERLVAK